MRSAFLLVASLVPFAGLAFAADAVVFRPLESAPYSASATVSPHAAKLFISGVSGTDAAEALSRLDKTLAASGVPRTQVVNVRASLLAGEAGAVDMEAWNAGWTAFFPQAAARPTRTTLGVTALPEPAGKVHVEAVGAVLPDLDAALPGRASLNPYVRTLGDGAFGASAATWVLPGAAIVFSAGVLADPADATKPERSVERFGSMTVQTQSVFKKLERTLASQGVQWEDIFYVRALLSPAPGESAVDFAGFGQAFTAAFPGRHPALRPALTCWAAPGFNANGLLVEIEVYAAAPDGKGPFTSYEATAPASPWLAMTGTPEAQISSSGAAARYRALTWFSGVVGTPGPDLHDESVTALLTLRSRLAAAGATAGDAVQLRAYPVVGDAFQKNMALWNEAYGRFFNHPKLNAHKPARTAFPAAGLPRGARIQIELITVER